MMRCCVFIAILVVCSCNNEKKVPSISVNEKILLLQTDEDFSAMSVAKGMKAAFIEYIDSNGILLKPGHLPIAGANAIDYLIQQNDTGFTLNWQPQNAFVSKSADLGYTYGVYALHPKSLDTVLYGTYVSIWKKQQDGKWKFVLDSGNEGIDSTVSENF
jgi:ketosteroid isomerase-like protein